MRRSSRCCARSGRRTSKCRGGLSRSKYAIGNMRPGRAYELYLASGHMDWAMPYGLITPAYRDQCGFIDTFMNEVRATKHWHRFVQLLGILCRQTQRRISMGGHCRKKSINPLHGFLNRCSDFPIVALKLMEVRPSL